MILHKQKLIINFLTKVENYQTAADAANASVS